MKNERNSGRREDAGCPAGCSSCGYEAVTDDQRARFRGTSLGLASMLVFLSPLLGALAGALYMGSSDERQLLGVVAGFAAGAVISFFGIGIISRPR